MAKDAEEMKTFIKKELHRIAITARILVEQNEDVTESSVKEFIANCGNDEFRKVFEMNDIQFTALTVTELLKIVLTDPNSGMT